MKLDDLKRPHKLFSLAEVLDPGFCILCGRMPKKNPALFLLQSRVSWLRQAARMVGFLGCGPERPTHSSYEYLPLC